MSFRPSYPPTLYVLHPGPLWSKGRRGVAETRPWSSALGPRTERHGSRGPGTRPPSFRTAVEDVSSASRLTLAPRLCEGAGGNRLRRAGPRTSPRAGRTCGLKPGPGGKGLEVKGTTQYKVEIETLEPITREVRPPGRVPPSSLGLEIGLLPYSGVESNL